jgi:hypothetical protein
LSATEALPVGRKVCAAGPEKRRRRPVTIAGDLERGNLARGRVLREDALVFQRRRLVLFRAEH